MGGNGQGHQSNQLKWPSSIHVDDDNRCIYIADYGNHRVLQWKYDAKNAHVVAGGNGHGNRSDQLYYPFGVSVDRKRDSLIICDCGNRRVVRWPRQNGTNGQTIISDIDCSNLTIDHHGDLYVSDSEKHEVRRYKIGETNGTIVAGGNGQGSRLDQLENPSFIFVDQDCSVYVSDSNNHRLMKWFNGAKEGIVVAGGHGEGNRLTQLNYSTGLVVDHLENIYVCDKNNNRIMYWPKESKKGQVVVGGNGEGNELNQLDHPTSLAFDQEGNIYVSDYNNNRIQKFHVQSK